MGLLALFLSLGLLAPSLFYRLYAPAAAAATTAAAAAAAITIDAAVVAAAAAGTLTPSLCSNVHLRSSGSCSSVH